jgi:arginyl-tRNA synthetase
MEFYDEKDMKYWRKQSELGKAVIIEIPVAMLLDLDISTLSREKSQVISSDDLQAWLDENKDEILKELAKEATNELQNGRRGYLAIWNHIINVSVTDLKKIYDKLNVSFELWKKESDAQPYIPDMVDYMKREGYAHIDQGALVVDVQEESDKKEIPPCMILKSYGATLYNTTDLATIVERRKLFNPDRIMYVVDKRQSLYFEQVFRCAKKTKII